jgi:hypothetical protein
MNNTNYPVMQEEFFISNEEKTLLKQRVCIGYSIEKADTRNISEFEVFSFDFESKNGTQYFRFEVVVRSNRFGICKRFDQFKLLHEEMEAELSNFDKGGMNISPPSYHIMPLLPDSDIKKVGIFLTRPRRTCKKDKKSCVSTYLRSSATKSSKFFFRGKSSWQA